MEVSRPVSRMTTTQRNRLARVLSELANRKMEALSLYEPLPEALAFHKCPSSERLLRGSNRSGKTLAAIVDFLWFATKSHPYLPTPTHPLRMYVVARDDDLVAQVIWDYFTRPGKFKIIFDEKLGKWRAYKKWLEPKLERKAIEAPPLLPPRLIREIAWKQKKADIPKVVHLTNGTEIQFYSGNAKPPQGTEVDYVLFDEEISDQTWYPECSVRLAKREGKFVWSATPESGTQGLWDLKEAADEMVGVENPRVSEFKMHITDNPYISDKAKRELKAKLGNNHELIRVKWEGEFAYSAARVFPQWCATRLGCDAFTIPKHWNRIASIDPGLTICAVLFAAVPPADDEEHGKYIYLYHELYIQRCTARLFAQHMRHATSGYALREMIIDGSAMMHKDMSGKSTAEQYSEALERENVRTLDTGYGFIPGIRDRIAGNLAIHDWLDPREDGTSRVKVFRGCLPNLDREMRRYQKKLKQGVLVDDPTMKDDHLVDALRYLRGRDPRWRNPPKTFSTMSKAEYFDYYVDQFEKSRPKQNYINLGPGTGVAYASNG